MMKRDHAEELAKVKGSAQTHRMSGPVVLAYWAIRGLAQPIRLDRYSNSDHPSQP